MTTCVFDNLDSIIDTYIEADSVTYYGTPSQSISIDTYLIDHEEDRDRKESAVNILKLIRDYFSDKITIPEKKPDSQSPDKVELVNNDPYYNYPKLTTKQFLHKMQLTRQKTHDIQRARQIHNWYRLYKDDVDELFYHGLKIFEDQGIDFSEHINTMYDHFVEEQYERNI